MAKTEVKSSCLVGTTTSPSMSRLELTTWDLRLLQSSLIQKGLIFHSPHQSPIQHLKNSLSRTLHFFPPLAGRLAATTYDDGTTSFSVDCNNTGAEFTHAVAADVSISDIIEPDYIPETVHSLFPLNDVNNLQGTSKPLLAVQVTELADGIFIGCSGNHAVVDGNSFWHFLNSWSEISRGHDTIAKIPSFERWYPSKAAEDNRRIHLPSLQTIPLCSLPQRVFHFSRKSVAAVKAKANSEASTGKISSLQAVLAHIWRSAVRCHHSESGEIRMMVAVGARARMSLPDGYFGNAAYVATVAVDEADLLQKGLGAAALQINDLVSDQTNEAIIRYVEEKVEFATLEQLAAPATRPSLVVGGSTRHDVYGNDFGWGKPIAVRSGKAHKFHGLVLVLPAAEAGGIYVEVCLPEATLEAMGRDQDFVRAFTTSIY